jgi:hypothetical protein
MKKKLLSVILSLSVVAAVLAQTVSYDAVFTWTPNPPAEMVTGYRIEYQKLPTVTNWTYITFGPSTSNTTATIKNLQPGFLYKFRAFAVNSVGIGTNQSTVVQLPNSSPSAVTNFSGK